MVSRRHGILVLFSMMITSNALAESMFQGLSPSLSLGRLKGEAKEYFYDPLSGGRKNVQLDWKIESAYILKGDLSLPTGHHWLALNISGWTTVKQGDGYVDDYSWNNNSKPYEISEHSWHSDTPLNYATEIDLNAKIAFFSSEYSKASAVFGFQQNKYSWTAKGGHYRSVDSHGDVTEGAYSDGELSVGYSQTFKAPYIGLAFEHMYQNVSLKTEIRYSAWTRANYTDEHYKRNFSFRGKADSVELVGTHIALGYKIDEDFSVIGEYNISHYKYARADMYISDQSDGGGRLIFENSAAFSNRSSNMTLGVRYSF